MMSHNWDVPARRNSPIWEREPAGWNHQTSSTSPNIKSPKFIYHLHHLAAFTSVDLLSTNDGLDKLVELDREQRIWPIPVVLHVDNKRNLVIYSSETKEEMERFPMNRVHYPVAITQIDRRISWRNLLAFSVSLESYPSSSSLVTTTISPNWEFYIFYCIQDAAFDVAKCIQMVKENLLNPTALNPIELAQALQMQQDDEKFSSTSFSEHEDIRSNGGGNQSVNTTANYQRRLQHIVDVLNACISEIELFIQRIDNAVRATQEREFRRSIRGKNDLKNKMMGDGLLQARSNLPTIAEFVDIFKKTKLCLNCIAASQRHLEFPNAAELIHALIPQLQIFIRVCETLSSSNSQYYYADSEAANLPQRIVAPLLTSDAIFLLRQCLTSEEYQVWKYLGNAWNTTKDKWKGFVPPYEPHFLNGFVIDSQLFTWLDAGRNATGYETTLDDFNDDLSSVSLVNERSYGGGAAAAAPPPPILPPPQATQPWQTSSLQINHIHSQMPMQSPRRLEREQLTESENLLSWRFESSMSPSPGRGAGGGAAVYSELKSYEQNYNHFNERKNNSSGAADYMRDYIDKNHERLPTKMPTTAPMATTTTAFASGSSGRPPSSLLSDSGITLDEQTSFIKSVLAQKGLLYRVIRERMAFRPKELSIHLGEVVQVLDDRRQFWRLRNSRGEEGYSLNSCLEPLLSDDNDNKSTAINGNNVNDHNKSVPVFIPPPPPPLPVITAPSNNRRNLSNPTNNIHDSPRKAPPQRSLLQEQAEAIAEELKRRQRMPMVAQRNVSVKGPKITETSTSDEVHHFLHYKGFSDKILMIFNKYTGKDMFQLTREQLDLLVPTRSDAARLESLLTVQKKQSNYATLSAVELQRILQRRKTIIQNEEQTTTFADSIAQDVGGPPSETPDAVYAKP